MNLIRDAYRAQPPLRRAAIIAAACFVVWHFSINIALGNKSIKNAIKPYIGFYTDGMRMGNTWGMFSRPPQKADVVVELERAGGVKVDLSTAIAAKKSWWERVRDARLRKIQARLDEDGERARLGHTYLAFWCEEAKKQYGDAVTISLRLDTPDVLDDDDVVTEPANQKVVMSVPCRSVPNAKGAAKATRPVQAPPPPPRQAPPESDDGL